MEEVNYVYIEWVMLINWCPSSFNPSLMGLETVLMGAVCQVFGIDGYFNQGLMGLEVT